MAVSGACLVLPGAISVVFGCWCASILWGWLVLMSGQGILVLFFRCCVCSGCSSGGAFGFPSFYTYFNRFIFAYIYNINNVKI